MKYYAIIDTEKNENTIQFTAEETQALEGIDLSGCFESRLESLRIAIGLGADRKALAALADALRLSRGTTIVLPRHHYEDLSRGRGWCRQGTGKNVSWGERVEAGYKVAPGRWSVGGYDGFGRKRADKWNVKHVRVGERTWTVASLG